MSQLTNEGNTGPDNASFSLNLEDSTIKKVPLNAIIGLWTARLLDIKWEQYELLACLTATQHYIRT